MNGKFFWLAGERFQCLLKKDEILDGIKEEYLVQQITNIDSIDKLASLVNSNVLFGPSLTVYLCKEALPNAGETISFINNLRKGVVFIYVDPGKPDKRTKFYKKLNDYLEFFEPHVVDGRVNFKMIKAAELRAIKFSGWNGPLDIFGEIFERCNHDYGKVVNEVKKIDTYMDGECVTDISQIEAILSQNEAFDIMKLVDAINRREGKRAMKILNDMIQKYDMMAQFPLLVGALIENFHFILYTNIARDMGYRTPKKMAKVASLLWQKKGREVPSEIIERRFFALKDVVNSHTAVQSAKAISKLSKVEENAMLRKHGVSYIYGDMLLSLLQD